MKRSINRYLKSYDFRLCRHDAAALWLALSSHRESPLVQRLREQLERLQVEWASSRMRHALRFSPTYVAVLIAFRSTKFSHEQSMTTKGLDEF